MSRSTDDSTQDSQEGFSSYSWQGYQFPSNNSAMNNYNQNVTNEPKPYNWMMANNQSYNASNNYSMSNSYSNYSVPNNFNMPSNYNNYNMPHNYQMPNLTNPGMFPYPYHSSRQSEPNQYNQGQVDNANKPWLSSNSAFSNYLVPKKEDTSMDYGYSRALGSNSAFSNYLVPKKEDTSFESFGSNMFENAQRQASEQSFLQQLSDNKSSAFAPYSSMPQLSRNNDFSNKNNFSGFPNDNSANNLQNTMHQNYPMPDLPDLPPQSFPNYSNQGLSRHPSERISNLSNQSMQRNPNQNMPDLTNNSHFPHNLAGLHNPAAHNNSSFSDHTTKAFGGKSSPSLSDTSTKTFGSDSSTKQPNHSVPNSFSQRLTDLSNQTVSRNFNENMPNFPQMTRHPSQNFIPDHLTQNKSGVLNSTFPGHSIQNLANDSSHNFNDLFSSTMPKSSMPELRGNYNEPMPYLNQSSPIDKKEQRDLSQQFSESSKQNVIRHPSQRYGDLSKQSVSDLSKQSATDLSKKSATKRQSLTSHSIENITKNASPKLPDNMQSAISHPSQRLTNFANQSVIQSPNSSQYSHAEDNKMDHPSFPSHPNQSKDQGSTFTDQSSESFGREQLPNPLIQKAIQHPNQRLPITSHQNVIRHPSQRLNTSQSSANLSSPNIPSPTAHRGIRHPSQKLKNHANSGQASSPSGNNQTNKAMNDPYQRSQTNDFGLTTKLEGPTNFAQDFLNQYSNHQYSSNQAITTWPSAVNTFPTYNNTSNTHQFQSFSSQLCPTLPVYPNLSVPSISTNDSDLKSLGHPNEHSQGHDTDKESGQDQSRNQKENVPRTIVSTVSNIPSQKSKKSLGHPRQKLLQQQNSDSGTSRSPTSVESNKSHMLPKDGQKVPVTSNSQNTFSNQSPQVLNNSSNKGFSEPQKNRNSKDTQVQSHQNTVMPKTKTKMPKAIASRTINTTKSGSVAPLEVKAPAVKSHETTTKGCVDDEMDSLMAVAHLVSELCFTVAYNEMAGITLPPVRDRSIKNAPNKSVTSFSNRGQVIQGQVSQTPEKQDLGNKRKIVGEYAKMTTKKAKFDPKAVVKKDLVFSQNKGNSSKTSTTTIASTTKGNTKIVRVSIEKQSKNKTAVNESQTNPLDDIDQPEGATKSTEEASKIVSSPSTSTASPLSEGTRHVLKTVGSKGIGDGGIASKPGVIATSLKPSSTGIGGGGIASKPSGAGGPTSSKLSTTGIGGGGIAVPSKHGGSRVGVIGIAKLKAGTSGLGVAKTSKPGGTSIGGGGISKGSISKEILKRQLTKEVCNALNTSITGKKKSGLHRRNIRGIFGDKNLNLDTLSLRKMEQQRLSRFGYGISLLTKKKQEESKSSSSKDVISIDSSDEDESSTAPKKSRISILRASGSKKDEIMVLSSSSEDEDEDGMKKKRKNSKDDDSLSEETEVPDNILELGIHTNDSLNVLDEQNRLLVNVNHKEEEDDIHVPAVLARNMKPHQIGGIRFLYDNLVESIKGFRRMEGCGCILAHAMGLGKTLQTIVFTDIFLRHTTATKVMCVVPVNTIQNWMAEFNRWLPPKAPLAPKTQNAQNIAKPKRPVKRKTNPKTTPDIVKDILFDLVDEVVMSEQQDANKRNMKNVKFSSFEDLSNFLTVKDLMNTMVDVVSLVDVRNPFEQGFTDDNSDSEYANQDFSPYQMRDSPSNTDSRETIEALNNIPSNQEGESSNAPPDNEETTNSSQGSLLHNDENKEDTHSQNGTEKKGEEEDQHYRQFDVFLIDAQKSPVERSKMIETWDKSGGVLLLGYEMYRMLALYTPKSSSQGKKKTKGLSDEDGDVSLRLKKAVCQPGPDLVVCDEGHRIKNYQSGISVALKSIRTKKRLVLTGYPLQNNLMEYWCMVDFVRPHYLGSRQEFSNMFERPIMNGQCLDSTFKDKNLMKQRVHVLHSLLQGFVQRRGHDVLYTALPSKEEHVIMVRMSSIQKELYVRLIELTREIYNDSINPIKMFCLCCKIWNHPDILYQAIRAEQHGKKVDIIGDEDDIALDDASGKRKTSRKPTKASELSPSLRRFSPLIPESIGTNIEPKDPLTDFSTWAGPIFNQYPYLPGSIENSGKLVILNTIVDESIHCGDKLLVFSQSLLTLDSIETFLKKSHIPGNVDGRCWVKGYDYYRLDGSTSPSEREKLINSFNDENNKITNIFLLSTRAGCLGINLIGANRVVMFDVSWNPCHDAQAVCRIYRYGQKKNCHIYRLVSSNTMEKKMYYRQISKQGIANRVVDEMSLTENFGKNEIASLAVEDWVDEPILNLASSAGQYNDTVLAAVLKSASMWVTKEPFKHESLLIDESSGRLSGKEKQEAKRAYKKELEMVQSGGGFSSNRPLQSNFPSNSPVVSVRPFSWRPILSSSLSSSLTRPNVSSLPIFGHRTATLPLGHVNAMEALALLGGMNATSSASSTASTSTATSSTPTTSTMPLAASLTQMYRSNILSRLMSGGGSDGNVTSSAMLAARDLLGRPLVGSRLNLNPLANLAASVSSSGSSSSTNSITSSTSSVSMPPLSRLFHPSTQASSSNSGTSTGVSTSSVTTPRMNTNSLLSISRLLNATNRLSTISSNSTSNQTVTGPTTTSSLPAGNNSPDSSLDDGEILDDGNLQSEVEIGADDFSDSDDFSDNSCLDEPASIARNMMTTNSPLLGLSFHKDSFSNPSGGRCANDAIVLDDDSD